MPYRNFRVPIYEHTDNKTIIHSSKRFFYFSIPFLNYPSAVGSATTSPGSMNCDSPSKCGTKKLKNKLPATSVSWWESVFIIIRLRSYLLIRWCSPPRPKVGSVNTVIGCLIKCQKIFGSQLSWTQKRKKSLIIDAESTKAIHERFHSALQHIIGDFRARTKGKAHWIRIGYWWCLKTSLLFVLAFSFFVLNFPFECVFISRNVNFHLQFFTVKYIL